MDKLTETIGLRLAELIPDFWSGIVGISLLIFVWRSPKIWAAWLTFKNENKSIMLQDQREKDRITTKQAAKLIKLSQRKGKQK